MNTVGCVDLPTVEECRGAATVIEDDCLRECVMAQCAGAKVNCGEDVSQRCRAKSQQRSKAVGGFVVMGEQTCRLPRNEINWCQRPMPRPCRAKAMAHELAHSCGWMHGDGMNVPADTGTLKCD